MEWLDVEFALDRIHGRVVWRLSPAGLTKLRASMKAGELGPSRILKVDHVPNEPETPKNEDAA